MKIALVGCGAAAKQYYVPALKATLDQGAALCLVDSNVVQARQLAEALGGCPVFADYREVLGAVDGLIIAVPHFLHYRIAMDALRAGVHVLCEKPLAESAREVAELNAAARFAGVALCVNNTRRMFPQFREVRRLLERQAVGAPRSISYTEGNIFEWQSATSFYVDPRVSSKGILLDLGAHVIDLVCWWLGEKPSLLGFEDDSFGGPESFASVRARAGGCDVRIVLNRLSAIDSSFRIAGDRGSIEGRPMDWQKLTLQTPLGRRSLKLEPVTRTYPEFVIPVVRNFIEVLRGAQKPLVSGEDVQASIALIEECYGNRRRARVAAYERTPVLAPRPGKVLVTGAGGFIGARVVELLHLGDEGRVRAGIRRWSSAARLGRLPLDITCLDVMDPASLERALDGVTSVVHCAKGAGAVNEAGTRNLLDCALRRGIKRFVHLSTADVYGAVSGRTTEEAPFRTTGTQYNASKIDAEKAVWEYAARGLPVTVLRPSIVYGPFSTDWSTKLAIKFLAGKGRIYPGLGDGLCNLVFVDDLVGAVLRCLESDAANGKAFNVVGPEIVTWNEYFRRLNDAMGLQPLPASSPARARVKTLVMQPVRAVGGVVRDRFMPTAKKVADAWPLAKSMMKYTERALKMTPSPGEFTLLGSTMMLDGQKIEQHVGFTPSWTLGDGLEATVAWLREQGFLGVAEQAGERRPEPTVNSARKQELVV